MAIAKIPKRYTNDAAEAFIAGAGEPEDKHRRTPTKIPAMIRFDPDLMRRVDAEAKRRGISRSAWIQYTLSCALDNGEG